MKMSDRLGLGIGIGKTKAITYVLSEIGERGRSSFRCCPSVVVSAVAGTGMASLWVPPTSSLWVWEDEWLPFPWLFGLGLGIGLGLGFGLWLGLGLGWEHLQLFLCLSSPPPRISSDAAVHSTLRQCRKWQVSATRDTSKAECKGERMRRFG
jgi:hypothetical protein